MKYNFQKFETWRRKPLLRGMEVGEIRVFTTTRKEMVLTIKRRLKAHPKESYSWDATGEKIAVRRDADQS
jgi:hypothetical protein